MTTPLSSRIRLSVALAVLCAPTLVNANILNFNDFTGMESSFSMNGSAKISGSQLVLTDDSYQTGAAWLAPWIAINAGFEANFTMVMSDPKGHPTDQSGLDNPGADGIAFVIQANDGRQLGIGNSGMGYMYIPNSLAVEFDVWQNDTGLYGGFESRQHIAVQSMGRLANRAEHTPVVTELGTSQNAFLGGAQLPQGTLDMKNGQPVNVKVQYIPGVLNVFLPDLDPGKPLVSVAVDLGSLLSLGEGGTAMVGFTASGSGAWQKQAIGALSVVNVPEPATLLLAGLALLVFSVSPSRRVANR